MTELSGLAVVVTGGGSGIGLATAGLRIRPRA
jgi:NAD(P)-dependent dehydrogenase (short-subunit alcohol dehydrogenase family)